MTTFTHAQLVEMAVAWLRRGVPTTHVDINGEKCPGVKFKCKPVFGEMVATTNERPDAIGWYWGSSFVVECKSSRADFFADRSKAHMQDPTWGMGRRRYYLVPDGLVKADEVSAWCGLAYARTRSIKVVKEAPLREISHGSAIAECSILASAIRRHALKIPFVERTGRFETVDVGRTRRGLPTFKQMAARRRSLQEALKYNPPPSDEAVAAIIAEWGDAGVVAKKDLKR